MTITGHARAAWHVIKGARDNGHPLTQVTPTGRLSPMVKAPRDERAPISLATFHGNGYSRPGSGYALTMNEWHDRIGLECCSRQEFAAWAGVTPLTPVYRFKRILFCSEGRLSWCKAERAAGRCVLNRRDWAIRYAYGDDDPQTESAEVREAA